MKKNSIILILLCIAGLQQAQNYRTDTWMRDLNKLTGNKPLSQLVLPGAYKAGINGISFSTAIPEKCSTLSQDTTVYGLLRRGARYLDITLICRNDSTWYLGTYNYTSLFGMQFATGQPLNSALQDLAAFMNAPQHAGELVVLNISGYADSKKTGKPASGYGDIDPVKKEKLIKKLAGALDAYLYKAAFTPAVTINQVLSAVQKKQAAGKRTGAIILLFNDVNELPLKMPGVLRSDSCGSKAGIAIKTLFYKTVIAADLKSRWAVWGSAGNRGCFSVMQWALTWRSTDNKCNSQMALVANTELEALIVTKKPAFYPQAICVFFLDENLAKKIIQLNINP